MAEEISVNGATREEIYTSLFPQLEAVLHGEEDTIANLANAAAILKQAFGWPLTCKEQHLRVGYKLITSPDWHHVLRRPLVRH